MEALIGALYLDCGIVETKKLVLRLNAEFMGDLTQNLSNHNPKGKIQEWVQENLPSARIKYRIIGESGPDREHFESEVNQQ